MKYVKVAFVSHISIFHMILFGTGSPSTSIESGVRYNINVIGSISTISHAEKQIPVEHITFNKMIQKIPGYEMPNEKEYTSEVDPENKTKTIRWLNINPEKGEAITDINFVSKKGGKLKIDTKEISIPDANIIWKFKAPKTSRIREYIEIIVKRAPGDEPISSESEVPAPNKNSSYHYLVSRDIIIRFDFIEPEGPQPTRLAIEGLHTLMIDEFKTEEDSNKKVSARKSKKKKVETVETIKNRSTKIIKSS